MIKSVVRPVVQPGLKPAIGDFLGAIFEDGKARLRKCEIVIQASKISGDLTNYELTLTEDNLPSEMFDADGARPAQNGGGDIRFASNSSGSAQLAIDVVDFTTDNNPANGTAEINVLVPAVSSSSDTSIWVFYNADGTQSQPAAGDTFGSDNAYRTNNEGSWSFEEDPAGTAPQMADRTANGNDGTTAGMAAGNSVAGIVGNALDFIPNDWVDMGDPAGGELDWGEDSFTWAAWIKTTATSEDYIITKRTTGAGAAGLIFGIKTGRLTWFMQDGSNSAFDTDDSAQVDDDVWHYVVGVFDRTADEITRYVDGAASGTVDSFGSVASISNSAPFRVGAQSDGGFGFDGLIDDPRVYREVLSADFLSARFQNLNDFGAFAVAGTATAA